MARISTYLRDDDINPNDIVIGSNYNVDQAGRVTYTTRNFRMVELQTFFQGGNFSADAPITITTQNDGGHKWTHSDITINSTANSSVQLQDNSTFVPVTDIDFGGLSNHAQGFTTKTFTLPDYQFQINTDDNGSGNRIIDIDSASPGTGLDTLNILGGLIIATRVSGDDTITIDHSNVTHTASTSSTTLNYGGTFTALTARTVSAQGHLTASTLTTYTLPAQYSFNIDADSTVSNDPAFSKEVTNGQTLDIKGGTYLASKVSGDDEVTLDLSATGTASASTFLTGNNTWSTPPGTYSFTISTDSNASHNREITSGQTLSVLGGTNLNSAVSADDTITINHDAFSTTTSTHSQSPASPGFGGNFTVLSDVAVSNGHVTDKESIQINMPSLPNYDGDDIDIDTGALTGATVISDLDFNITTNTLGHVTDANGSVATRTLTLSDLGYTGDNDATKNLAGAGLTLSNVTFSLTETSSSTDNFFKIPFMNSNVINVDSSDNIKYNPSSDTLSVNQISIGTTSTVSARSILSEINGPNYFEIRNTNSSTGGRFLFGATGSGFNGIYSRNHDASAGREFRLLQLSTAVITVATDGDTTFTGNIITTETTDSTSGSGDNGSLRTLGGASIAKKLYVGDLINSSSSITGTSLNALNSGGATLNLSNSQTTIVTNTTLGTIEFQAPNETGSDATAVAASIKVRAEENFDATNNQAKIEFLTANDASLNPRVTIASNGNTTFVGVVDITNTTNSTDASGDTGALRTEGGGSIAQSLFVGLDVTANDFVTSSDKRLKSDIQPIKEGLDVIKKFTSYNYIKAGKKESGFIAQEVQQVLPHAVSEDSNGMLSMSDRNVLAHIHKSILELDKRLTSIEDKIK